MDVGDMLKSPNEAQSAAIRKALREDPDRLESNVKLLENWISYQKHLPQNYDKRLLYAYVRGCKHDMEKAKNKIEMYFAVRSTQNDLCSHRILTTDGDLSIMDYVTVVTLPEYTPQGYRVTVLTVTNSDVDTFDQLKFLRLGLMLGDLRAHIDNFVGGEIVIFDQGVMTAALVAKSITNVLKRAVQITQDVYPSLIKQIHIITDKPFIDKMMNVIKYFLKEKLRNRIHVHRSYQTLTNFIPLKCLPSDYGGSQKSMEELNEEWREMYMRQSKFFEDLDNVKITGEIPKKLAETFSGENSFGVEGSFRKLNID